MDSKLTPEAAFEILTQIAYAHVGNRQTHETIAQALSVVKSALFPQPKAMGPVAAPRLDENTEK